MQFVCSGTDIAVHAFFKLIKNGNKVGEKTSTVGTRSRSNRNAEIKLALIGLITSGMYLCLVFCWISFLIGSPPKLITVGWYYLSDLFVLTNPYLLLAFSSVLRKQCKLMLRGNESAKVQVISHQTTKY